MPNQNMPFDTNRPIYRIPNTIYRTFLTGLLWIVCSLPVITIGAATTAALAEFSDEEHNGPHKLSATFFQNFKRSFKKATAIWICVFLVMALLVLDITFYQQLPIESTVVQRVVLTVLFILADLLVGICRFAFFFLATDDVPRSWHATLKTAAIQALLHLPTWACMMLIDLALLIFFISAPYFLFLLLFLPGVLAMIHSRLITKACRSPSQPEDSQ